MIETLLNSLETFHEDTGNIIFLHDPDTNTDLSGNGVVVTRSGGAISTPSYLIDGQGTTQFPTVAAKKVAAFSPPLNLTATNWTLEWSSINDSAPTSYALELGMMCTDLNRSLFMRYGDSGFLNRIQLLENATPTADVLNFSYTKAALVGSLSRWALVCKDGRISAFRNGVKQSMAKGPSSTSYAFTEYVPVGLNSVTSIVTGDYNGGSVRAVPGHHGRMRLSDFARYTRNYTPGPLTM